MLIDIRDISQGRASFIDIEMEIGPAEWSDSVLGNRLTGLPRFKGRLAGAGKGSFSLTGRLLAAVTGECARCLKPVSCELDIHVDELYRSGAAEETSETEDCYRFAGWSVDLLPALRDNLVLAIPLRLYCREDCRGICATCGADLNEKPCGCATAGDKANTPFSKLKELL